MNVIDQLIAGRDPLTSENAFSPHSARAEQLFAEVVATHIDRNPARRIRPRILIATAAATVVVTASILIPLMGANAPSAAASELQKLASAAASNTSAGLTLGQFEYTQSVGMTQIDVLDSKPYFFYDADIQRQTWFALDGAGRIDVSWVNPTFPTWQDKAAYQENGSPTNVYAPDQIDQTFASGPGGDGTKVDETTLPTNPSQLYAYVQQNASNRVAGQSYGELQLVASLLEERYTPPSLLSALLTVTSEIPAITLDQNATLPDGGAGVGFVINSNPGVGGAMSRMELILNPSTGTVVGEEDWQVPASGPMDITLWMHYLKQDIVNSTTQTVANPMTSGS
jgi:hypothetical protein